MTPRGTSRHHFHVVALSGWALGDPMWQGAGDEQHALSLP
jgi:hypothetical protein